LKSQRKKIALKLLNITASIRASDTRSLGEEFNKPHTLRDIKPGAIKRISNSMLFTVNSGIFHTLFNIHVTIIARLLIYPLWQRCRRNWLVLPVTNTQKAGGVPFNVFPKTWYTGAMNKKTPSNRPQQAYVLRASIKDASPPIRRKLSVPADCTLGDLHGILQIAFGWENGHLHSFTVNSVEYGMADTDFDYGDEVADEDTVCLYDLDLQPNQKFSYLYDFGDSWAHEIKVSKIISAGDEKWDLTLPRCLEGKRAGPLEDSGGVWGYESMLEVLKDPNHPEYKDIHEWAGDFDPEYVSIEEINASLEQAFKPRQRRPEP
jgi:hypothetical protein